jgi:hypothetical protein
LEKKLSVKETIWYFILTRAVEFVYQRVKKFDQLSFLFILFDQSFSLTSYSDLGPAEEELDLGRVPLEGGGALHARGRKKVVKNGQNWSKVVKSGQN